MANEYLYKPDIIKIRGVHGTNEGDNQEADIGFPMVGMHTLFENDFNQVFCSINKNFL